MEPEREISEIAIPDGDHMAFAQRQLNLAFRFTVTPLVVAFICCAGWWWWRYEAFAVIGAFDLLAGFIALFVSLGLLSQARKSARISGQAVDESFGKKMNLTWLLVCASLPAAVLCIVFAIIFQQPVIYVRNRGGEKVSHIQLIEEGHSLPPMNLGDLEPGESRRFANRDWSDDMYFTLRYEIGGQTFSDYLQSRTGQMRFDISADTPPAQPSK